MSTTRRILVAVKDTQRMPGNALRKAAALARASGATIELYHAMLDQLPSLGTGPQYAKLERAYVRRLAARRQERLAQLARTAPLRGLTVHCTAAWDFPAHEAIIRRALATRADLVIATAPQRGPGARWLLAHTDWELIRHCPVPLLLVKSRRAYRRPVLLAAVDPFHAHAKPSDLDARLLRVGGELSRLLSGTLHVFHAYMPLIALVPMAGPGGPVMALPPEAEQEHRILTKRDVERLAQRASVPDRRCHVEMGSVASELDSVVARTRADIVVMGAVSRSALKRIIVGNTAERVLDGLKCDVLIVKPRGYRSAVVRLRPKVISSGLLVTPRVTAAGRSRPAALRSPRATP